MTKIKFIYTVLIVLFLQTLFSCMGQNDEVERDMGLVAHFTVAKQMKILLDLMEQNPGRKKYTLIWTFKVRHTNYEKKIVYKPTEQTFEEYENIIDSNPDWKKINLHEKIGPENLKKAIKKGFLE